jgi:aspartate kinase
MMSKDGISLYLPNHSPESIGFAVTRDQYAAVNDLLDGLVLPLDGAIYMTQIGDPPSREAETQAKLLAGLGEVKRISISLTEGLTMVSLVGAQFRPVPGVFFEVLTTLSKASIPVFQTSDSDLSMTVLIAEADTRRAVRVLHDRFNLFDLK